MGILEDVNKNIREIWEGNFKVPDKMYMPYVQAEAMGIDVSQCIPGEVVEISSNGVRTVIVEDEV